MGDILEDHKPDLGALLHGLSPALVAVAICYALNFVLIYRGLSKGIEAFCKWAMPALILAGIVILAATTTETGVEEVLSALLEHGGLKSWEDVEDRVRPDTPAIPTCQIPVVDLGAYDLCLEGSPS